MAKCHRCRVKRHADSLELLQPQMLLHTDRLKSIGNVAVVDSSRFMTEQMYQFVQQGVMPGEGALAKSGTAPVPTPSSIWEG